MIKQLNEIEIIKHYTYKYILETNGYFCKTTIRNCIDYHYNCLGRQAGCFLRCLHFKKILRKINI